MSVYFSQEADGRGHAIWRADDASPDEYLCGVSLALYNTGPRVRELFAELVNAAAVQHRRRFATEVAAPAERLSALECSRCEQPEALDIMHRARQCGDLSKLERSPAGHVLGCCKTRVIGGYTGRPNASRPTARF